MFCIKCGQELPDGSLFCSSCGEKLAKEVTAKLKCKDCGGELNVDPEREFVVCPYCGSKEVFIEETAVKVERIKSKTVLEHEYIKNDHEKEMMDLKEQQMNRMTKRMARNTAIIFVFFFIMYLKGGF